MNREWNELHKSFLNLITKTDTFEEGKAKLLELRKSLFDMVMTVKNGFNQKGYSLMPFPDSKGYASKTMAYSIFRIARIEDIVCHSLLKNDEQIFDKGNYKNRLGIEIITAGDELQNEEIVNFSKQIDLNELFNYLNEVYLATNEFIKNLVFENLKIKASSDCGNINTLDLLKKPFSRYWITHIEGFLKIKNQIVKEARKQMENCISVCGLSCNHCFLGQWCGSCRSEYNCCSYGTLFDGGICPNVKCASEKNLEGCYNCPSLDTCEIGFYVRTNDGSAAAKASAMFIRKYGNKRFVETLDKMHKKYDFTKMQEIIGHDCIEGVAILESFMNE